MKKFSIIILAVCTAFAVMNSCKKTGGNINPLTDVANLSVGSYLVIDSTINPNLNSLSNTSTVGVIVHQYPLGETVDHIILYATLGTSADTTQWKMVKSLPYTAGSKLPLTATTAELSTAFGVPSSSFTPGALFTFFPRAVTKSGKTFDINNAGDNGGGGLITGPAYYSGFSFTVYVVCPFTGGMAGTYTVVKDDWQDWTTDDEVEVTDGPGPNQINISQIWPNPVYGSIIKPLIINVNPTTGEASVTKVDFGDYGYIASATSASGYVFSCTKFITLSIEIAADGSDQGAYKLILKKKP
ncbi:MAG: hypothetical protein ABJC98_02735 [Bacteroidota bacterium]